MRKTRSGWVALAMLPLVAAAACTTTKSEAPAIAGPSELGLSLSLAANPDTLTKDGASQSTIVIMARNAQGQPASGVGLRVETAVGGALIDYGRLSTKTVTTGGDGRAQVVYTAPAGPPSGNSQEDETMLSLLATPAGTDFSNAVARTVTIRLVPSGVILPPAGRPIARFSFAPTGPTEGQDVSFDASGSLDCPSGVSTVEQCAAVGSKSGLAYAWDFGDGTTGTGVQATHRYARAGSYTVALTVTNERGNSDRTTSFVNVGAGTRPTASFNFSPNNPEVGQSVFFNASASTAGVGRVIVSYDWTFGDGASGEGATITHRFGTPGTWTVTLTVTDDLGKTGTVSQGVTLGADLVPTADFVFSPADPKPGDTVNFDARPSLPPAGRSLTRWEWNFGDGATAEGERVSHRYPNEGTYTVTLTVTDSSGARKSATKTLPVKVPSSTP
jgi:PKD repeat protein